ncbi:MAG: EamA family transporter RarD [Acidimicrobiia bacterium]|nr:EamA family transporter RarD [Acidimicrobiia bacterium]
MTGGSVDRRGFWLGVAAYGLWGLSPIYWNLLDHVPVMEVLANRVTWSVPLLAVVVLARNRWPLLVAQITSPATVVIAIGAAVVLALNWGIFIWGVSTGHVVEASLGYFINPLLSVALGVVVLRERLSRGQTIAVGLAAIGVLYMTVRMGTAPWISLVLATSFAIYGLLKKHPKAAPALEGLLVEISSLFVPALVWVGVGLAAGDGQLGGTFGTTTLLVGAGLITVVPLLAFGEAAKRIPLSMIGLLQYLAPSLQFILGVFVYGEVVGSDRLVGFVLVWLGLVVLSAESLLRRRREVSVATATS